MPRLWHALPGMASSSEDEMIYDGHIDMWSQHHCSACTPAFAHRLHYSRNMLGRFRATQPRGFYPGIFRTYTSGAAHGNACTQSACDYDEFAVAVAVGVEKTVLPYHCHWRSEPRLCYCFACHENESCLGSWRSRRNWIWDQATQGECRSASAVSDRGLAC